MIRKSVVAMAMLAALLPGEAFGEVPGVLNFSGHLGTGAGDFTGAVNLTVTLWDDPSAVEAGHDLWVDTFDVYVDQGRFHVLLGADPSNPLPVETFAGADLYVGVAVDEAAEMTPRMRVVSVPFALRAGDAQTLQGSGPDAFAAAAHVHAFADMTGQVAPTQLPDTAVFEAELTTALAGKSDVGHLHDARYVNEGEADSVVGAMVVDGSLACSDMGSCGCIGGQVLKWDDRAATWSCGNDIDTDTTYSGMDFALSDQACNGTDKVKGITATGAVICGPDVDTDTDTDTDTLASLLCAPGQVARWDGFVWACDDDRDSGGDITEVNAGTGLSGGGTAGAVTLSADTGVLQARVSGNCAVGSAIRVINADGTVECDERTPPSVPRPNTIAALDGKDQPGKYTSMTIGADGLPVISYYESSVGALRVAKCADAACTSWSQVTLDTPGVGEYSSIAIGTDGTPVISYYDATNMHLKVAKCSDDACSAAKITRTTVDSAVYVGQYTSITIGTDGLPVISYWDVASSSLKVAHCGNAACSAGNTLKVVDAGGVGMDTSIAIGMDGLPVISYYDSTNRDLKVAHCGSASCSGGNTLTAVDSTGSVGQFGSITVGMDGLPVISYYDATNYRLKILHCGNAACSSGNSAVYPDYAFLYGFQHTSITIGADGMPIVSYFDVGNGNLKVAKCGTATCGSGTVLTTVDSADSVGQYSSITVGPDGLPVISYFDLTNIALKVAKCANAYCIPNWTRR